MSENKQGQEWVEYIELVMSEPRPALFKMKTKLNGKRRRRRRKGRRNEERKGRSRFKNSHGENNSLPSTNIQKKLVKWK